MPASSYHPGSFPAGSSTFSDCCLKVAGLHRAFPSAALDKSLFFGLKYVMYIFIFLVQKNPLINR